MSGLSRERPLLFAYRSRADQWTYDETRREHNGGYLLYSNHSLYLDSGAFALTTREQLIIMDSAAGVPPELQRKVVSLAGDRPSVASGPNGPSPG